MRILVTGSNGFVGSYVVKQLLDEGCKVYASSRSADLSPFGSFNHYHFIQADLTDPSSVHHIFETAKPHAVVHCAAMSKPDDCERDQQAAYKVNVEATVNLLNNAADYRSHFIHISTDFIFNGNEGMHTENDLPDPISHYGHTKLKAEDAVRKYKYDWTIVRIVFVYGKTLYGRDSFITMIAKKLKNNEPYRVVDDQERTPTFAPDLSGAIYEIIKRKATGVYNICGKDVVTPYQMAMKVADILGIGVHKLVSVTCNDFKEIARRPLKSGLNIGKARRELNYNPLSFEEGVKRTLT